MTKQYTLACNWKMNLTFSESIEFAKAYSDNLASLTTDRNINVIIFPNYLSIYSFSTIFSQTPIKVGSQNCSNHSKGNFTGQVSAQSLHQAGCTYAIVGHSESREYGHETTEEIIQKITHLIDFDISPIICIGENAQAYNSGGTIDVLNNQVDKIIQKLKVINIPKYTSVSIAYEPIWSIGTGKVPNNDHLEVVFGHLKRLIQDLSIKVKLLYGGSVNKNNVETLKAVDNIDGFLVGGASTDYDQLVEMINKLT